MQSLITFSHLRWDFVYQRPQHLMTRLGRHYRVFFCEEPVYTSGRSHLQLQEVAPNVTVCRPHTSSAVLGFHDEQLPVLQAQLEDLVFTQGLATPVAWLYTPMALPLVQRLDARMIVYDCMDELSAFLNAPRQLLQRESALLRAASLVFTGGPSLYRSKRSRHESVHCFPSSVEADHFAQARDPSIEMEETRALPHPRLGFYGVIDERMDLALVDKLAAVHPEWQIVMVGPVVKIDAARLPRRPNIHYFGQQSYADLPRFLAGWDLCLLPFALNEATRFISPTKTLEYMAAEKPIVSTPVTDVVDAHGCAVHCGAGDEFIRRCEEVLASSVEARAARIEVMRETVKQTSWETTAAKMKDLIEAQLLSIKPRLETRVVPGDSIAAARTRSQHPVVVIGAGPTGLSAAYHVGEGSLLLEQHERVGGLCRSIEDRGFTFDYAGHIMFSNDADVHRLYWKLLGNNVHWQDREAWIYSKDVYTRYPFQGALYGLPADVLTECIMGAIEARFGSLKPLGGTANGAAATGGAAANGSGGSINGPRGNGANSHGANGNAVTTNGAGGKTAARGSATSTCKDESLTDCCGDGIPEATVSLVISRDAAPRNFEEFIYKVWGRGVAKHFALPYNRKLWAVPLKEMETSWLGGRVPLPDLQEMVEGALRPVPKPMGPNARFGYPLRGGFQALMDGFLPLMRGDLKLNARVVRIVPSKHEVMLAEGSIHSYGQLICTMPLPVLVKMIGNEAPEAVRRAAAALRHVSVRCVNLGIDRENVTDKHWIYYPEDSVFHRIFVQGNASPHCNPPGGFGLTCEITYSQHKPLPCDGEDLIDRCIQDCIKVGIINESDKILASNQVDLPYAYVIYDHDRARHVALVRGWMESQDIFLAGRYGEWEYYNSDHAFIAGKKAAEVVLERRGRSSSAVAHPPGSTKLPDVRLGS